jgi:hypothetical protein
MAYLVHPGLYSSQLFNKALHRMNAPKEKEASKIKYKLWCHAFDHAVFRSDVCFVLMIGSCLQSFFTLVNKKISFQGRQVILPQRTQRKRRKGFFVVFVSFVVFKNQIHAMPFVSISPGLK